MRILGIDYGDRHLGLALSDPLGITAQPLCTYTLQARDEDNKRWFRALVAERAIERIVVGNPLRMDGTEGTRAEKTRQFADWLRDAVGRPVELWDERLTTREAQQGLDGRLRGRKRKAVEDQAAAVIILSAYLESRRGGFA